MSSRAIPVLPPNCELRAIGASGPAELLCWAALRYFLVMVPPCARCTWEKGPGSLLCHSSNSGSFMFIGQEMMLPHRILLRCHWQVGSGSGGTQETLLSDSPCICSCAVCVRNVKRLRFFVPLRNNSRWPDIPVENARLGQRRLKKQTVTIRVGRGQGRLGEDAQATRPLSIGTQRRQRCDIGGESTVMGTLCQSGGRPRTQPP